MVVGILSNVYPSAMIDLSDYMRLRDEWMRAVLAVNMVISDSFVWSLACSVWFSFSWGLIIISFPIFL